MPEQNYSQARPISITLAFNSLSYDATELTPQTYIFGVRANETTVPIMVKHVKLISNKNPHPNRFTLAELRCHKHTTHTSVFKSITNLLLFHKKINFIF